MKKLKSAAGGWNVLGVTGSEAEVVAQLVIPATEPRGRSGALEAAHRPISAFQPAMVLFQAVVAVAAGPVAHFLAQLGPDRTRIAVVAIGGAPLRRHTGTVKLSGCDRNEVALPRPAGMRSRRR